MPANKLKIVNPKYQDDEGNPVEAEIIATSFARWEAQGWEAKKDDDGEPDVQEGAEPTGDGEPSAAQQKVSAQAQAKALENGASPEDAAKAGAEAAAKQKAQEDANQGGSRQG